MNKKTKKAVTIMSICLVVLIVIAVVLGLGKKNKDSEAENPGQTLEEGADQSELDVIEEEPAQSENVIVEKADASYERWLAAGTILGISLQYPEYEFTGIYLASESELGDSGESDGVYVVFECGGEEIAIHSKPIGEERTESGTKDLYTEDLGYASFDEVDADSIDKDECETVELDELSELINQSVLVTVYEH